MSKRMVTRSAAWIGATLLTVALAAAAAAAAYIWLGLYDISSNRQHTQAVYTLLEKTMHQSVKRRAAALAVPPLGDAQMVAAGGACYVQKCAQCHGGPGFAQSDIGRSMQPLPGPLVDATLKWTPAELYWITRNGIKMSGMPAWQHRMRDEDLWAVVAFLQRLPLLTAAEFRATVTATAAATAAATATATTSAAPAAAARCEAPLEAAAGLPPDLPPDARRGRDATTQYACNACHLIPGVTGSDVSVGPPLAGFATRRLIAGAVGNDTGQLVRWIRDPQSVDPQTTMPNLQVSERDARDIAAYLLTLD